MSLDYVAHLDFETRSACDLKRSGAHRYFEDPSTEIILARWCVALRGQVVPAAAMQPWPLLRGAGAPPDVLIEHIRQGCRIVAHNAGFEMLAWEWLRRRRPDLALPPVPLAQWECTMAKAAVLALPLGLDGVVGAMGLAQSKDMAGYALMRKMSKPRKVWTCAKCFGHGFGCSACGGAGRTFEWYEQPDEIERLGVYCGHDVAAETGVDAVLPPLTDRERRVWELDATINSRGIMLDRVLIERCLAIIDAETSALDAEMHRITGGAVSRISQAQRLVAWIRSRGVECESIAKGEQEDIIVSARAIGDPLVEQALEVRGQAKTSTAKYRAMMDCMCDDGSARGQLQYYGASTGRWAGRLIQPQNLYRVDPERDGADIDIAVDIVKSTPDPRRAAALLNLVLASTDPKTGFMANAPMVMLAKCVRSAFIARPGRRFIGGDSANIEGRVNAWVAGEEWKLDAFRAYDAKMGPDLYNISYASSFGGDPSQVKGMKRQIGKVQELALGYQGSIGAYISMAKNYFIKPADICAAVKPVTEPEVWETARKRYHWRGVDRHGLPEDEWTALRIVVNGYRTANPAIVQSWWDLQDAAIEAVENPEAVVPVLHGRIMYMCARGFLWCALPSGRVLAYAQPRVVSVDDSYWILPDGARVPDAEVRDDPEMMRFLNSFAEYVRRTKRRVDYFGVDGPTKRWTRFTLYGGLQCENIVQALARDTLVEFAFEAEARGYPIVLTVHDELLAEVPIGHGSADEMREIMQRVPAWAEGLPLAAKTWEGDRYNK